MDFGNNNYTIYPVKTWLTRLIGVGLVVFCLLLLVSLLSYNIEEVAWSFLNPQATNQTPPPCTNILGKPGLYIAGLLFGLLGIAAIYAVLLTSSIACCMLLTPHSQRRNQWISLSVMIICSCTFLSIQPWIFQEWAKFLHLNGPGGKLGYIIGTCIIEPLIGARWTMSTAIIAHALALVYFCKTTPKVVCIGTWHDICGIYSRFQENRRRRKEELHYARSQWKNQISDTIANSPPSSKVQATVSKPYVQTPRDQAQQVDELAAKAVSRPHIQTPRATPPPPTQSRIRSSGDNLLDLMTPIEEESEYDCARTCEGGAVESMPINYELEQKTNQAFGNPRLTQKLTTHIQEKVQKAQIINTPRTPESHGSDIGDKSLPSQPRTSTPEQENTHVETLSDYQLPPYELLDYKPVPSALTEAVRVEKELMQNLIIDTLENFKISVDPGPITRGPSFTRYEIFPPKGLRVNRIANLHNDLMLATQSKTINILAPVPGRNTVGIELENETKTPVYLRELLQSEEFHNPKLKIPVALGKNVYGQPVIGDLAALPHTLVAGTTGSGKSVCINSMILSMLYKFRPDELKLILVDPKVVEMQPYHKLPHLACEVVTQPARVIGALRWAVNEMEHRYKLFSKMGVRNLTDFNNCPKDIILEPEYEEQIEEQSPLPPGFSAGDAIVRDIEESQGRDLPEETQEEQDYEPDARIPDRLPYIVIIIDELADLMQMVKEDLENYIARLTQKARAAGIHLVVATQTPRAQVLTGTIKANIPSRIALKVSSPLDSRIILDTAGAENLLGKGDLLFVPEGGITKMCRAQGAFVSDKEIADIISFCAAQAKQNFETGVTSEMNSADDSDNGGRLGGKGVSEEDAELYTRCVNLVVTERKASTSLLQRRFSIGYGRAAKIMDLMEARGVIGPSTGPSRPREVLVDSP